jgi:hypothetical protein
LSASYPTGMRWADATKHFSAGQKVWTCNAASAGAPPWTTTGSTPDCVWIGTVSGFGGSFEGGDQTIQITGTGSESGALAALSASDGSPAPLYVEELNPSGARWDASSWNAARAQQGKNGTQNPWSTLSIAERNAATALGWPTAELWESPANCAPCAPVANAATGATVTCTSAFDSRISACAQGFHKTAGSDASPRTADICSPDVCTVPSSHAGYDVSGCVDVGSDGISAGECSVSCAAGHSSTGGGPTAACAAGGGSDFVLSGCSAPCDASTAPANGDAGTCTASLAPGLSCLPTCDEGFVLSTSTGSTCSLAGALTAASCVPSFGTLPELAGAGAWRCECDTNATRIGAHPRSGLTVELCDTASCSCRSGYEGTAHAWDAATQAPRGWASTNETGCYPIQSTSSAVAGAFAGLFTIIFAVACIWKDAKNVDVGPSQSEWEFEKKMHEHLEAHDSIVRDQNRKKFQHVDTNLKTAHHRGRMRHL